MEAQPTAGTFTPHGLPNRKRIVGSLTAILAFTLIISGQVHPTRATPTGSYFDHVVIIMMENEGIRDICNSNPPPCNGPNAPYLSSLANTYGISEQYLSLITTSAPNYYGILGASIPSDCSTSNVGACYPPLGSLTNPNLVDSLESAGLSWKGYMENQNVASGCDTGDHVPYEAVHNGFVYFQDIVGSTARCSRIVLANPTGCTVTDCTLIDDLNSGAAPNFMWLTPNDCNNMHATSGCSNGCTSGGSSTCLQDGDNYLASLVPNILNSATYTSTRAALFIVFDEGTGYCPLDHSSNDCLYAIWAGPAAQTNFSSSTPYDQYSLTKTIEANWNLPSLTNNDANATPMVEFLQTLPPDFTVETNPTSVTFDTSSTTTFAAIVNSLSGFSGTVNLSTSISPASGLNVNCNPTSISGGSGSSTCTLSSSTPGNYTVTVNGSNGSLSHSTNVNVSVTEQAFADFDVSASPASLTLSQGASGQSTLTLSSLNSFTGTVSMTASVSPSGLTASLSPASVTLSSNGQGTSTLTVASSNTSAGTYTVTVTGTSGSLSHSVGITVTITGTGGSPYALVVSYEGYVYKLYPNNTLVRMAQPVTTQLSVVAWKPDGSYALIIGNAAVLLKYDGTSLTPISTPYATTTNFLSMAWRPDGSYALIGGSGGALFTYNGTTITQIRSPYAVSFRAISWAPDGSQALLVGYFGAIYLFRYLDGQITKLTSPTSNNLGAVAWNPTGSYALLAGSGGTILKYDGTNIQTVNTAGVYNSSLTIRSVSFDPSGSYALLVGDSGLALTYDGTNLTTLPVVTSNALYSASWSSGIAYIVGGQGTLLTYSGGVLSSVQTGLNSGFRGIAWRPS
ncbi:hypothetical protein J2P12_02260 [Candidatus Bathyarchaeota archaeon]|nr:hypothetical protein [Candidatus Bathyarchaeota archaeon]